MDPAPACLTCCSVEQTSTRWALRGSSVRSYADAFALMYATISSTLPKTSPVTVSAQP